MIKTLFARLFGGGPRKQPPPWRMPVDRDTARRVYAAWDRLNGRYYQRADLRLPDGTVLEGVLFDGDSRVAVEARGRPLPEQPDLFGVEIEIVRLHDR